MSETIGFIGLGHLGLPHGYQSPHCRVCAPGVQPHCE